MLVGGDVIEGQRSARSALASAGFAVLLAASGCGGPEVDADGSRGSSESSSAVLVEPGVEVDPESAPGAMAPRLSETVQGALLSWLEPVDFAEGEGEKVHRLRFAHYRDGSWTEPQIAHEGGGLFANWADLPAVVEAGDGTLVASWLEMLGEGTYAYGVRVAASEGDGAGFRDLGWIHDDTSPTEHGFVSWAAGPEGLRAVWLDGRAMEGGHGDEGVGHGGGGDMALRTALLPSAGGDGGAKVMSSMPPPSEILDPRVCECCSTDLVLAASGPVVAYRDRSEGEIRDISVVTRRAGGWSAATRIHDDGWTIPGCPVNGPALAAEGDTVAAAWFTAAGSGAHVRLAWSLDGGSNFAPPVDLAAGMDGTALGRVDVVLAPGGQRAWVTWLHAERKGAATIRLRPVSRDGGPGPVWALAETTSARSSGFPQLALVPAAAESSAAADLLLVWVETGETSRLRARRWPLSSLPAAAG